VVRLPGRHRRWINRRESQEPHREPGLGSCGSCWKTSVPTSPGTFTLAAIHLDWRRSTSTASFHLGEPSTYADLRVAPADEAPYFIEVKFGLDAATMVAHLRRKFGEGAELGGANRLVLVVQRSEYSNWLELERTIRAVLPSTIELEVWDEERLGRLLAECFGIPPKSFDSRDLLVTRALIDQGKERLAFGSEPADNDADLALRSSLLWHFGTWRLRELRHLHGTDDPGTLVPPGVYEHVVVVFADLAGYSRYVRDTADDATVREHLTTFYARSRYQIINAGGMISQFLGDGVVALFGVPDRRAGYVEAALRAAVRLCDIADSVSHSWQREIDNVQSSRGAHIAMSMGKVQLVGMRPFDPARLATIGDCIGLAARLLTVAQAGEIVVSNVLQRALDSGVSRFEPLPPLEARNMGPLQPWRLTVP